MKGKKILPPNGKKYADRSLDYKGMIIEGDTCHKAFRKYGWTWGGTKKWLSRRCNRDYQHFQKKEAKHKVCN